MKKKDEIKVCLVGSSGGHLTHLYMLKPFWKDKNRFWVTFDKEDARSLLEGEKVYPCYFPTNRSIKALIKNTKIAWDVLHKEKPDLIISCGAAVAVPFFYIGKMMGAKLVYIEVFDRIDKPTMTGKMVYEADLLAALEAAGGELPACSCTEKCAPGAIHTDCEVCAVNMTECAGTAPEPAPVTEPAEEPEPEPQQKSNTGTLLLILAVAVLGGGAGWYLKIYRPKHEKAAVPEEDYSEELADYDDPEDDGPPWDEDDTESEDNE